MFLTAHGGGGLPTFKHGVHPPPDKAKTEKLPLARMPFVSSYVLPLGQHIGAPSVAVVEPGDDVVRGQLIARPGGFVSTALHAPVSGRVKEIGLKLTPGGKMGPAIVIQTDPWSSQEIQRSEPVDPFSLETSEVVKRVQMGGIVGLGGAAFPSHVKLSPPEGRSVSMIMLNGVECEPYLTCDHRVMLKQPEKVIRGAEILTGVTGAKRCYIGVENNKPDAVQALKQKASAKIDVVALQVKYPQGAEKMLIDAVIHQQVPMGGLPLDLEVVANNVATAAAIADLFDAGVPLVERAVTVTGPGIKHPRNLIVPLGTPLVSLLDHCGGLLPGKQRLILGGPMMGAPQKSLDVPTVKGTSGVLCMPETHFELEREQPCIRCGRCLDACPMFLNPARLAKLARAERPGELQSAHLLNCFECASCSFVCPSHIPLVQWMRVGKGQVRSWKASQ